MAGESFSANNNFRLGAFDISPDQNCLSAGSKIIKIEPMVMEVLTVLAERSGEVVRRGDFLKHASPKLASSDESLTRAVSILRKTFSTNDPNVTYIETISKRGYRLRLIPQATFKCAKYDADNDNTAMHSKHAIAAYELYLQGQSLNERPFHKDALINSEKLLKYAVEIDDTFADAFAELGNCYSLMSTYLKSGNKEELIKKAALCAGQALAIDPNSAFAMTLIALEQLINGNIVGAIKTAEKAYSIAPQNSEVAMRLGYLYAAIGQIKRSIPYIEQSILNNPTHGRNFQIMATIKLCDGDYKGAEKAAKRAIDMQHHFSCETHAAIAFAQENYEEAGKRLIAGRAYLTEFLGDDFNSDAVWEVIIAGAYSPNQKMRETLGNMMIKMLHVPNTPPPIPLAQAIVRTGPTSAFFEIMGNNPPPGTHGTLLCIWDNSDNCIAIRNSEKFLPFAQKMGMIEAWKIYGKPDCMV